MGAGRSLADAELAGDLPVGGPLGDQNEDLTLAAGKRASGRAGRAQGRGQQPRNSRVKVALACRCCPDRGGDLVGAGIFEQVAGGTSLQSRPHLGLLQEAGHGEDLYGRPPGFQLPRRLNPVHDRHQQVHQHHIGQLAGWFQHGDTVERVPAVASLTHDGDVTDHLR
jgi:hypothetical protein